MNKAATIETIISLMREQGICATEIIATDSHATTRGLSPKEAYEHHREDIDADAGAMGVFIEPYWDWHDPQFVMGASDEE